jgi:hypothetical protein
MFRGEFAGCRVLSPIKKRCFESEKLINFRGFSGRLPDSSLANDRNGVRFTASMKFASPVVWVLLAAVGLGCTSSQNTNLTPRSATPSPEANYLFETTFRTHRRGVQPENVKAWVVMGLNLYPMQPVPNTENRFEALLPLPTDRSVLRYRYKFQFTYPGVLDNNINSTMSPEYELQVNSGAKRN